MKKPLRHTAALLALAAACSTPPATLDATVDSAAADAPSLDVARESASPPDAPVVPDAAPLCPAGQTRCGAECVDTATSSLHCGACGRSCTLGHALAACVAGACDYNNLAACDRGYGNCDGMVATGCETDTSRTPAHCGACDTACGAGQGCLAGACVACPMAGANCPPRLLAAVVQSPTQVLLRFDHTLDRSAADPTYYTIAPGLAVVTAALTGSGDQLTLTTATQTANVNYTVTVGRADTNGDGAVDQRDANLLDVAGNPIDPGARSAVFTGMGPEVYAITDVLVSDNGASVPSSYTGLSQSVACTNPYIPSGTGTRVGASDVNTGIGGTTTGIWLRYARLRRDATTRVLTGITAQHWSGWTVSCPPGYEVASGTSGGRAGALTTGTRGSCWDMGLCVRYEPLNTASTIVTNASLTNSDSADPACASMCESNGGYWAMNSDDSDIHSSCGDGRWVRVCSNSASPRWPSMPSHVDVTDAQQLALMSTYAPRVYEAAGERYHASSVEFSFPHLERYLGADGNYSLRTRDALASPSDTLPYFAGDLATAPIYAYWADKAFSLASRMGQAVDVMYFAYFPYNRGKDISAIMTVMGNHVGDWEHVSVRLMPSYDTTTGWGLAPVQFYASVHNFGFLFPWSTVNRHLGTHPIVYSADGSHGMWPTPGDHVYMTILSTIDLVDNCSMGAAWDTWNRLVAFDYNRRVGLGGATWPQWNNRPYTDRGAGDPSDPASGPIYRWGNPQQGCIPMAACRLEDGPSGPVDKGVWGVGPLQ